MSRGRTIRLSKAAEAGLERFRQLVQLHGDGMIVAVGERDDKEVLTMASADKATDAAVIAFACHLAGQWLDPELRAGAIRAEAARQAYIRELENAWQAEGESE